MISVSGCGLHGNCLFHTWKCNDVVQRTPLDITLTEWVHPFRNSTLHVTNSGKNFFR